MKHSRPRSPIQAAEPATKEVVQPNCSPWARSKMLREFSSAESAWLRSSASASMEELTLQYTIKPKQKFDRQCAVGKW